MTEPVLPDSRRVKRAVRWGLIRTVGGAIGWVFGFFVFLSVAGVVFDASLDHHVRFERVIGRAFVASHPDYEWQVSTSDAAPWGYGNTMTITGRLRGVATEPVTTQARLHQNALGHLSPFFGQFGGPVSAATDRGRPGPERTGALLASLPAHSRAVAIVELKRPYVWDGGPLAWPVPVQGMDFTLMWLQPPYDEPSFDGPVVRRPLTWPAHGLSFQEWVHALRDSDAPNLRRFGLPSVGQLREIGRSPAVYAYLTGTVDTTELARLAQRPDVESVRLVDVQLPLS